MKWREREWGEREGIRLSRPPNETQKTGDKREDNAVLVAVAKLIRKIPSIGAEAINAAKKLTKSPPQSDK